MEGERLRVTRGPKEHRSRPAVDVLFLSAAYSVGPRVIGVVLSGMLDDGTAGLWAIKDRGGAAVVQTPREALFASIPESALAHVAVDYTLAAADMPAVLSRLAHERSAARPHAHPPEAMGLEVTIGLEGNALQGGVMQLGPVSPNTCPECHGVLVRIQEGPIARYRCHTGHAFSLQPLLAEVNEEIDATLWNAVRAIEERILLLRELEQLAQERQDRATARQYAAQAQTAEQHVQQIRALVLSHSLFGQASNCAEDA